jgi:SAM-dependent methyltransferase
VIQNLVIESTRFGFEPEVTAKLAKSPCVLYEVPISYHGRTYEQGKKITWRDGLAAFGHIVRYNLFRSPSACVKRPWREVEGLVAPPEDPDHVHDTLAVLSDADGYNKWMFDKIRPYLGKRIIEIGSGIGNFSGALLSTGPTDLVVTDTSPLYLRRMRDRLGENAAVHTAIWDLNDPPAGDLRDFADSAVCLNVLEHIPDDLTAMRHIYASLAPGGRIVALVPAKRWLYGTLDERLGHYRRYEQSELESRIKEAGFELETTMWMNALGMTGWFVNGRVLRRQTIQSGQVKLFERLVPMAQLLDSWVTPLVGGLSLICVARRPARTA